MKLVADDWAWNDKNKPHESSTMRLRTGGVAQVQPLLKGYQRFTGNKSSWKEQLCLLPNLHKKVTEWNNKTVAGCSCADGACRGAGASQEVWIRGWWSGQLTRVSWQLNCEFSSSKYLSTTLKECNKIIEVNRFNKLSSLSKSKTFECVEMLKDKYKSA